MFRPHRPSTRPSIPRPLLALVAAALALLAVAAPASACPTMQFFGVRGSGEHSNYGRTIGSVLSAVNARQAGVGNQTIEYPAVSANPWEPRYARNYISSVRTGEAALALAVNRFRNNGCTSTPIVIAGYSQGAEVVDHWLDDGWNRTNVVGQTNATLRLRAARGLRAAPMRVYFDQTTR